mgnify:CR=1 FL=1
MALRLQIVSRHRQSMGERAMREFGHAGGTIGRSLDELATLVAALDDDYWQVRLRAVRALGQLRDAAAAPAVAPLLSHPISNLRKEAALALGYVLLDTGAIYRTVALAAGRARASGPCSSAGNCS